MKDKPYLKFTFCRHDRLLPSVDLLLQVDLEGHQGQRVGELFQREFRIDDYDLAR